MTKLTINRKPKGIYGTPQKTAQAAQQQNKTTSAHKVMPDNQNTQQKLTGATPRRRMTKQQRKNRRRVNRLIELWPELFSPESPKPLKVGIFDDLIQDIAARGISLGQGTLRATLARYVQTPPLLPRPGSWWRALRPERPAVRRGNTTTTDARRKTTGGDEWK